MNQPPPTMPDNATGKTLRLYSDALLAVRQSLTDPQAFSGDSLSVLADGLGTGTIPFPGSDDEVLALWLDLWRHKLVIGTSLGTGFELTLRDQSAHSFADALLQALAILGVFAEIDTGPFTSISPLDYDADEATQYLELLRASAF